MEEEEDIIILDEDDDEYGDVRNATIIRGRRPGRRPSGPRRPGRYGRPGSRPGGRPGTVIVTRPSGGRQPSRPSRFDDEPLSKKLIRDALPLIAAFLPLPQPPSAQGEFEVDFNNAMAYQQALAQHAKRDEQIRTLAQLGSRYFN